MRNLLPKLAAAALPGLAAVPALAHDGHVHGGLAAGLLHPVGGADHLLATLGLGLVAGLVASADPAPGGRGAATLPVAARAAAATAAGGVAGALWATFAGRVPGLPAASGGLVEAAVAVGLLALAAALLAADRLGPRGLAALALAVFVPHGWLHASEGTGVPFFAGLAIASVALFAAGASLSRALAAGTSDPGAVRARRARWAVAAGYAGACAWLLGAAAT